MTEGTKTKKGKTRIENIRLIPNERIEAEKVTRFKMIKPNSLPVITEERKVISFKLEEISVAKLRELRRIKDVPMFFLKNEDKYFYACIPQEFQRMLNFDEADIIGDHKCSPNGSIICCKYLSAAPDELGGCAKVRDCKRKKMENYPFITTCYQVVNTMNDVFCVCACTRAKYNDPRPKLSRKEMIANSAKLLEFCDFDGNL
ncbi:MAG: hypothetical protein J5881_04710 [Clostridia bacterium]|nr:hypothetical protein [Clostridia bacterium]